MDGEYASITINSHAIPESSDLIINLDNFFGAKKIKNLVIKFNDHEFVFSREKLIDLIIKLKG